MHTAPRTGRAIIARRDRDGAELLVRWAREQIAPAYDGVPGSSGGGEAARFGEGWQSRSLPGLFPDRNFTGWQEPQ